MDLTRPFCHINWRKFFTDWVRYDHDDALQYVDDVNVKDTLYVYKCKRCGSFDVIPESHAPRNDIKRKSRFLLSLINVPQPPEVEG